MLSMSSLPTFRTVDPAELVSAPAHSLRPEYDCICQELAAKHRADMLNDDNTNVDREFWQLLETPADPAVIARESAQLNEWAESILEPYTPKVE